MFLEKEILAIRGIQKELGIEIKVSTVGLNFLLEDISSINIPDSIRCENIDQLINLVRRLNNQSLVQDSNKNVVYLYDENKEEEKSLNNCKVLPFSRKEKSAYSDHGYRLAESDPKDMERALLFINNLHKTRDKYPEKLEKIFKEGKNRY